MWQLGETALPGCREQCGQARGHGEESRQARYPPVQGPEGHAQEPAPSPGRSRDPLSWTITTQSARHYCQWGAPGRHRVAMYIVVQGNMSHVPLGSIKPELDFSEKEATCLAGHTRACCRARRPLSQARYNHDWYSNSFLQFTMCLFKHRSI